MNKQWFIYMSIFIKKNNLLQLLKPLVSTLAVTKNGRLNGANLRTPTFLKFKFERQKMIQPRICKQCKLLNSFGDRNVKNISQILKFAFKSADKYGGIHYCEKRIKIFLFPENQEQRNSKFMVGISRIFKLPWFSPPRLFRKIDYRGRFSQRPLFWGSFFCKKKKIGVFTAGNFRLQNKWQIL